MFLRKEALDQAGLLDEDYFMYGEDIDMSYRLLHTDYNNYYFPETTIVHFKGKSSKRNSISDILHFYRAMRIYVRKHYKGAINIPFRLIVVPVIYLRELFAIVHRKIQRKF
jgi:GT2 family glycosyltransferase